jgi:hypothetical protein
MYSEAVEALLAMGEYSGPFVAFLSESVRRIQGAIECSGEEAERVLEDLRAHGEVDCETTPGHALPASHAAIPMACWYWYVRPAA